jgi:low temperature requirement protein LtrA
MGAGPRQVHVRMRGRSRAERHRASTPLELLFDLTFVVAVASLTSELAKGIHHGNAGSIPAFLMVFAAVWWAWINFTWFASAFDVDDALYRVLTLVQMAGVLVLAAGVPTAFVSNDFRAITIGYVIMRVAMLAQWLRAGIEHPETRQAAFRYVGAILVVQLLWVARLILLPPEWYTPSFLVLIVVEMAVPVWAEWRVHTTWHPGHIAERYSLFLIILLGEVVAAATGAMQGALAKSGLTPVLLTIGFAGLALLFSIWWLYFLEPAEEGLRRRPGWSYFWGYGHYLPYAAIAALGAGLEVAVEVAGHEPKIGLVAVGYSLAVPTAVIFVMLFVLHRPFPTIGQVPGRVLLTAAVASLLVPLVGPTIGVAGMVVALALIGALAVVATIAIGEHDKVSSSAEHSVEAAD